jgi:transposase
LNVLAQVAPDWLRTHADPEWVRRYDHRVEDYRLPTSKEERLKLANEIGADGWKLLSMLSEKDAPAWLQEIPPIQTLRWIWEQQFHPVSEGGAFRTNETLVPAGQMHNSPYDLDASYAKKRNVTWVGDIRSFHRASATCKPLT